MRNDHVDVLRRPVDMNSKVERNSPAADLHTHTKYSDGVLSPGELIEKANRCGLTLIAVTDHDTVAGLDEAITRGAALGVEVVPGIELSVFHRNHEIHILGYYINYKDPQLSEFLLHFQSERMKRAEEIVKKLNGLDIPVTIDDVLERSYGQSVGRPHIASAVVDGGYAHSYLEVFKKYIGYGKPAYVDKFQLNVTDAVGLIKRAGGLSFLAHPSSLLNDDLLFEIIKYGIDGIETIHPSIPSDKTSYYHSIAQQHYLLESGGSDFHGGKRNDEGNLGKFTVPLTFVDSMRKRIVA